MDNSASIKDMDIFSFKLDSTFDQSTVDAIRQKGGKRHIYSESLVPYNKFLHCITYIYLSGLDSLHFGDFYRNLGNRIIGRLGVPITCCYWL